MARITTEQKLDLRNTWEGWRDEWYQRLECHCAGAGVLNDRGRDKGLDAVTLVTTRPMHHVLAYVNSDAAEWLEANPRMTWADFLSQARPTCNDRDVSDGEHAVRELERWRDIGQQLADLIVEARAGGITWGELEASTGLTRKALNLRVIKQYGKVPEGYAPAR